ncbi:MAG: DUF1844 domain-containing protein [Endomicrobiales bacterium]|nr:DUF1844 domain-containing protein [Endomicrobiales bacterium]
MDAKNMNPHFLSLIMMFSTACWQHLGKVPNPMTGKTEKELSGAQMTIDMLCMLRDKTKGNLSADEEKYLSNVIGDLQLNYADEVNKDQQKPKEELKKDNSETIDKEQKQEDKTENKT